MLCAIDAILPVMDNAEFCSCCICCCDLPPPNNELINPIPAPIAVPSGPKIEPIAAPEEVAEILLPIPPPIACPIPFPMAA